jgi:hypothetical protein
MIDSSTTVERQPARIGILLRTLVFQARIERSFYKKPKGALIRLVFTVLASQPNMAVEMAGIYGWL